MATILLTPEFILNGLTVPSGKSRVEYCDTHPEARGLYIEVSASNPGHGIYRDRLGYTGSNGGNTGQTQGVGQIGRRVSDTGLIQRNGADGQRIGTHDLESARKRCRGGLKGRIRKSGCRHAGNFAHRSQIHSHRNRSGSGRGVCGIGDQGGGCKSGDGKKFFHDNS